MIFNIPFDVFVMFFAASIALAMAPGPDNIFVLTQSALYGRKAGLIVTIGLCTGLAFYSAAVAIGIATIFTKSEFAFNALKIIGAFYLLFLAWKSFTAGAQNLSNGSDERPKISLSKLYKRGIIMNITNPKVAIFILAFLPQFADPQRGNVAIQLLFLGFIFICATILIFGAISFLAGTLGKIFQKSDRPQIIMNKLAGIVFVALAMKLLMTHQ